ncbi:MAG: nitrous oxide reductase accessory protein NosL [Anaeromyxobacter sp.]|nr:nitrous oxide reductase accessory protein NosL [Anaeromyxobacter sp.]MBL0275129.1 nitrous oxide reductase accessory protein NosL [Anaeromyxobacter sp.]
MTTLRHPVARSAGLALLLGLAVAAAPAAAQPAGPARQAAAGAPAAAQPQARPGPGDKCPVCGMFVAKYPDWVAGVVFRDGAVAWFDGAKDLFKFLLKPERYGPARRGADVVRVFVTDYYAVTQVDARDAWFVIGSDVFGPMGTELVPFGTEADAREFLTDHHGSGVLRFSEVGAATIKQLQDPG